MKKKWKKPELVILARGKREESVLTACKYNPTGPTGNNATCRDMEQGWCDACWNIAAS